MKLKAWHTLAAAAALLLVGCTATPFPKPTPTPDWTLERIKRDHMAEQLSVEADAIAGQITTGIQRNYYQRLVRWYVPVYMAKAAVRRGLQHQYSRCSVCC